MIARAAYVLSILILSGALVRAALPAEDDGTVAWSVAVVTKSGAEFSGIVPRTERTAKLFDEAEEIDPASLPPGETLSLDHFNGLNGSIGFTFGELAKLKVVAPLTADDVKSRDDSRAAAKKARLEAEAARLELVTEQRAARAKQELERAAAKVEAGLQNIPEELRAWLDEFPPEEGWVPAKKSQLYYQQVVLNTHTPTPEERRWLDNFEPWKAAYDLWLEIEKAKRLLEEEAARAAAAGEPAAQPLPASERPEPSGTSGSDAAATDPDKLPPEEAAQQPPPIDPDAPEPKKIAPHVPEPAPLKKGVPEPVKVKEGGGS
ncbi:MAG: hypothetical protein HY812_02585 [Planctomycetes bacterium]|nr:hypothetical protein [Planctomycetota bacterium]